MGRSRGQAGVSQEKPYRTDTCKSAEQHDGRPRCRPAGRNKQGRGWNPKLSTPVLKVCEAERHI